MTPVDKSVEKFACHKRIAACVLIVAAACNLTGCIQAAIIGTATGVMVANDRRQPEVVGGDERVEWTAASRLGERYPKRDDIHVNVNSYNYTVLLTGEVPNEEIKGDIEKLMGRIASVKNVVNDLQVGKPTAMSARGNDSFITGKVKGNFVTANKFSAIHVKVITENAVVYLLGLVSNKEADDATGIARGVNGVRKVVRIFEYVSAPAAATK
ncbi:MAG: BON domain-containing protein [Betaproteobacteria bacterium]|nr:BON domain-containing protein [Betaproteobacteria bacterium]